MNAESRSWWLRLFGLAAAAGILLAMIHESNAGRCPFPMFRKSKEPTAQAAAPKEAAALPAQSSAAPVDEGTVSDNWQVAWTSSLDKVRREPRHLGTVSSSPIRLSMARNEYESAQVLLIGGKRPAQIEITVGDLLHENGKASFPVDVVEIRRVDYVQTVKPDYPVEYVGAWPDALPLVTEPVDLPAAVVQPIWITVGAPDSLIPGTYTGPITIRDVDGRTEELTLEITVWDFSLPRRSSFKTAFDFYRSRLERAYREAVPGGAAWDIRFDELQHLYMLDMLKHRVWPMLNADPFSERFRSTMSLYRSLGQGAFSVGAFGGNAGPNGNAWPEDAAAFNQAMVWYREAVEALRQYGVLFEAYIYAFDEPKRGDPRVPQVLQALKQASKDLRTLVVLQEPADPVMDAPWLSAADILCFRINAFDPTLADAWRAAGKEVWMYVSSPVENYPSLVIDKPALDHRLLPWLSWKAGASGLLYWCVNFWEGDPLVNPASFAKDQNGNGFLYYPGFAGPIPSIRLEVLRDGIEDYEYLALLRTLLQAAETKGGLSDDVRQRAAALLAVDPSLVRSLKEYTHDANKLLEARRAMAELILQLQASVGEAAAAPVL